MREREKDGLRTKTYVYWIVSRSICVHVLVDVSDADLRPQNAPNGIWESLDDNDESNNKQKLYVMYSRA